jgi:hypothetical protein
MSDYQLIIKEELFTQNNTATLFHRTQTVSGISTILKSGWRSGGGSMYGEGIYTTYILADQLRSYMYRYGTVLVKFKYTGLDNLLCFSPDIAKKVHGSKYSLIDQINKLVPNHGLNKDELSIIESFQDIAEKSTHSSNAAKRFVDTAFFPELHSKLAGIEYYGSHDGHCIVIYPPGKGLELIAYAKHETENSDVNKINWINSGTKKTFTKAFAKGIFTTPDIQLPFPFKKEEQIPFMEFIKKIKEKDEVNGDDVDDLFKYSFSNKALLSIFEKLNPKLLRSDAYLNFFKMFRSRGDKEAEIKVLKLALQNRPSALLNSLYSFYDSFDESFKKELPRLLLTTSLLHLGEQGKRELGKLFHRLILDPNNDKNQLKTDILDYIIKNNLYEWFTNVRYNETDLLFQSLFAKTFDLIEFINKAKANNFNLNDIIPYIASWLSNKFSDFYTDDELIAITQLLKDYPNSGKYFNAQSQGPVAYRLANIFLTRHPEQITARLLPSIVSSITQDNIDLLDKINTDLFKSADRLTMFEALKTVILKSNNGVLVQKIWKYALLTPLDQIDYIKILVDLPTDTTSSRSLIWEVFFKNIVSSFILHKNDVGKIINGMRYPSDKIINLFLNELANPNQFEESIFYLVLDSQIKFGNEIVISWIDKIHQQFPRYLKNIITNRDFSNRFLNEDTYNSTKIITQIYLKYAPEAIENMTPQHLFVLLKNISNSLLDINELKNLLKIYVSSDTILNKTNQNLHLQSLIFSQAPLLNKNASDQQTVITILEKLLSINPDFINSFGSRSLNDFFVNSKDKKFAVDIILKYKNINLNYNDFDQMFKIPYYQKNTNLTDLYLIDKILEIKKDKLDERSVNLLVSQAINSSKLTSSQIIEMLKNYNPEYIKDINRNVLVGLLAHAAANQTDLEYIENLIFSLPINENTTNYSIVETLIESNPNKLKIINKILDSNRFTLTNHILVVMLTYANDVATINKIIKSYKFDDVDGKKLASLYNTLTGSQTEDRRYIQNKNAIRLFLNAIGNRLNALSTQEQINFLAHTVSKSSLMNSPTQLIVMRVRDISQNLFMRLFRENLDYDFQIHNTPSSILKILLKYNNNGWNIENFFKAVSSSDFRKLHPNQFDRKNDISKLFAITLQHEGKNLKARTLKAILDASETTDEKQKIVDIVLNPRMKGSNLDSNDVFVIVSIVNQMYDDTYSTKVILNILRLVNQNITDNMIVNLVGLCPATINNQIGTEYVANRILIYLKDNLSESAIYNLIRLQSEDDSKIRIINKILSTNKVLTANDVYNIITLAPAKGLRDIVNKLIVFYDKDYIVKVLKNRGLDPNTVLTELKKYKKYYYFKNISL